MAVPKFLLRKLYKRDSLLQLDDDHFCFTLVNVLSTATVVGPPRIVVNGVNYKPEDVETSVDATAVSPANPHVFAKGDRLDFTLKGRLLRGGNRLQVVVETDEFGKLEIFIDGKVPDTVDLKRS